MGSFLPINDRSNLGMYKRLLLKGVKLSKPVLVQVSRPPLPAAVGPFMLVPHSPSNLNSQVRSPVVSRPSRTNRGAFPLAIQPAYHSIIGPPVTYSNLVLHEPHLESLTLLPVSGCLLTSNQVLQPHSIALLSDTA
jgi:hypothetical protein